MLKVPSSLIYQHSFDVGATCYSASHRENGDILVGAHDGVHLFRQSSRTQRRYGPHERVNSVVAHRKNTYVLHRKNNVNMVDICLADAINMRHQLFEFTRVNNEAAPLAVSDRYAIAWNPDTTSLHIYDFISKKTTTVRLSVRLSALHFLPDGDLLAATVTESLIKYSLKSGGLTVIWTCEGLSNGRRVSSDSEGLIYVVTNSTKKVYIVSPAGKKIKELPIPDLSKLSAGYISVDGGQLAVPGWGDKKVHLFKII